MGKRQIAHALRWLRRFLEGNQGELARRIRALPKMSDIVIQMVMDASPWGMGGVLFINGRPKEWFASPLEDYDLKILEEKRGMPDGQASFEALAILIALRAWAQTWQDEAALILTRSDSMAALGAVLKSSAGTVRMNRVTQELALDMAEGLYEPAIVSHLPAQWNVLADALSRMFQPGKNTGIPHELNNVPRVDVDGRGPSWWRTQL